MVHMRMGREVGNNWKQLGRGSYIQNTLYENNLFLTKEKSE